jgi:hypothetical protein
VAPGRGGDERLGIDQSVGTPVAGGCCVNGSDEAGRGAERGQHQGGYPLAAPDVEDLRSGRDAPGPAQIYAVLESLNDNASLGLFVQIAGQELSPVNSGWGFVLELCLHPDS